MDDALTQVYARLTVLEFAVELIIANWLAGMPDASEQELIREWKERSWNTWAAGTPAKDDQTAHRIIQDSIVLTEHFLDKVARRSREIRAGSARAL